MIDEGKSDFENIEDSIQMKKKGRKEKSQGREARKKRKREGMRREEWKGKTKRETFFSEFLICSFPKYFFISRIFLSRFVSLFLPNFCWANVFDLECVFVQSFVVISTFIIFLLLLQCFLYYHNILL